MRRADRLFHIIQVLRRARRPVTARSIAGELETSLRTIYRDIAELQNQHVPIRGEAGVGYILGQEYDMPPLMLTPDEIEAAVLGAQWVASRGDPALSRGARDLIAKIDEVVPAHLRPTVLDSGVIAASWEPILSDTLDMGRVRASIRTQCKLRIRYNSLAEQTTERVIWPIAVAYFETARLLIGWCELRRDFRHFRTDRIESADFLDEIYPRSTKELREEWWEGEKSRQRAEGD